MRTALNYEEGQAIALGDGAIGRRVEGDWQMTFESTSRSRRGQIRRRAADAQAQAMLVDGQALHGARLWWSEVAGRAR